MAFHVEIRRSYRHARAFNLSYEELVRTVLEPWRRGTVVDFGEIEWEPAESKLTVLEGPEMAANDMTMGRGWSNAESVSDDVTARLLGVAATVDRASAVAVLGDTPGAELVAVTLLEQLGLRPVEWSLARARILSDALLASDSPETNVPFGATLLIFEEPEVAGELLFDAGLAVGALGARTIVAILGDGDAPAGLEEVGIARLDAERPETLQVLAARLREAGCRPALT